MRFYRIMLGAGAALLAAAAVAAQEPPATPIETETPAPAAEQQSKFGEAFAEPVPAPPEATEPAPAPSGAAESPSQPTATASEPPPPSAAGEALATKAEGVAASESEAEPPRADVPKKGDPPTKAFMAGVWAEPGKSCETALDFKADGTLIGPFPRWELSPEGELTMVGSRQKIWLKVIDKDTMQSRRSETDPPRTLKRC